MKTRLLVMFFILLNFEKNFAQSDDKPENNDFAFKLFNLMRTPDSNFVYSPFSVFEASALLYAGANGETKIEIANLFGFENDTENFLKKNAESNNYKDTSGTANFKFYSVNSIWTDNKLEIRDSYISICKNYAAAQIFPCDFAQNAEKTRIEINSFVSRKTKEKIKNLLPPNSIDDKTRAVLVNALYFKALWENSFDKSSTAKGVFHAPKSDIEADFMNREGQYKCLFEKKFSAVAIPYKEGSFEMLIILPNDLQTGEQFFEKINSEQLKNISVAMESQKIHISMPKFKMNCETELSKILQTAGMNLSFTSAADFSGMTATSGIYVSGAFHSAFIEVNETGTEAAAATAYVMGRSISANLKKIILNSPFMYFIRNTKNNEIIFMGICNNPKF